MDASGIDMQLLLLTSPGVQVFDAATAMRWPRRATTSWPTPSRKYPTRYAGLAAVAPQDPARRREGDGARRAASSACKGVDHQLAHQGEWLDDPKFWDIFAAAEALDVPIYIHPNSPPRDMIQPFLEAGSTARSSASAETGLHVLRIIVAGVFDRFPKLKIVIGHAARRCRSGCTASTTCTRRRCAPSAIRT